MKNEDTKNTTYKKCVLNIKNTDQKKKNRKQYNMLTNQKKTEWQNY